MASSATVKMRDLTLGLTLGLPLAARTRSPTWISPRNSSPLKTVDITQPMAAASRPQLGDDLPPMPRTSKTRYRAPNIPHMNCCPDGRIGMTTSHVSANPEEVPPVPHRIFQQWQNGDCEIDVRTKKIPDKPVLLTSILFELSDETELGQHNIVQGIEEPAVAPGFLDL